MLRGISGGQKKRVTSGPLTGVGGGGPTGFIHLHLGKGKAYARKRGLRKRSFTHLHSVHSVDSAAAAARFVPPKGHGSEARAAGSQLHGGGLSPGAVLRAAGQGR